MTLTVTDLFCGAGGSSQGATAVPDVQVVLAANHWQLAVDTHAANFPTTDHDTANISQADPRRYRRTNILWASPECTNHSQAKGRRRDADTQPDLFGQALPDEAAVRSRATMWDVARFAEHHRYDAIVVENVVDAARLVMWPAWLHAMSLLGYQHRTVWLNSMHAPAQATPRAPQSRDRLYVVFWRSGHPAPDLDIRPAAWCSDCGRDVAAVQWWKRPAQRWGRYRAQYLYRCPACHQVVEPDALAAAAAIDWTLPGQRIGDRNKPLRPATLARIEAGLRRYGQPPFISTLRSARPRNSHPDEPLPTIVADGGRPYLLDRADRVAGLVVPVAARDVLRSRVAGEPLRTHTGRLQDALVVPYNGATAAAQPAQRPLPTVTTIDGAGVAFIASLRGGGDPPSAGSPDTTLYTPHSLMTKRGLNRGWTARGHRRWHPHRRPRTALHPLRCRSSQLHRRRQRPPLRPNHANVGRW